MGGDVAGAMQVLRDRGPQQLRATGDAACRAEPVQRRRAGRRARRRPRASGRGRGRRATRRIRDAIAVAPRERILERGQQPAGPPVRGAQREPVRGAGAGDRRGSRSGRSIPPGATRARRGRRARGRRSSGGRRARRLGRRRRPPTPRPRRRAQRRGRVIAAARVQHERRPAVHRHVRAAGERRPDAPADAVDGPGREVPARDHGARRHQLTAKRRRASPRGRSSHPSLATWLAGAVAGSRRQRDPDVRRRRADLLEVLRERQPWRAMPPRGDRRRWRPASGR